MHGIVAAGAVAAPAMRELGIERIPLLCVAGETLLARACRCLVQGAQCEAVHALAPDAVPLPALPQVARADYSGEIVGDVLHCIETACSGDAVLLASADMPLITPEAIRAIVQFGNDTGADVVYPVVQRAQIEAQFPGTRRTYARLGPVTVSGGNVFWLRRSWVLAHGPLLRRLFAKRKNPVGLARVLGLGFVVRLLLGRLNLPYLERHVSQILHGSLRAAILPHAELAVDLDKVADLATFKAQLDPWR